MWQLRYNFLASPRLTSQIYNLATGNLCVIYKEILKLKEIFIVKDFIDFKAKGNAALAHNQLTNAEPVVSECQKTAQNLTRRPAVGLIVWLTWKPFARPPYTLEIITPA